MSTTASHPAKRLLRLAALLVCVALLVSCSRTPKPTPSPAETAPGQTTEPGTAGTQTAAAPTQGYEIYYADVGKGDCALIALPGGKWALVDAGPESGAAAIHGLMSVLGVKQFEAVFISHPHNDHIGNLDHILSLASAPVIYTGPATFEKASKKLEEIAAGHKVPITTMSPGQSVNLAGVTFTAMGPNGTFAAENDNSLVLMMEFGGVKALFPGDQQTEAEAALVQAKKDVRCTILKVGHHGQDDASSEAFLRAAAPRIAVITTSGEADKAPAPAVTDRLKALGATTYVVGQTGTLRFSSADESIAPFSPPGQAAGLVIEAVDVKAEYVDIKNPTDADTNMTGWCLLSEKGNQTFFFPEGFVLKSGETVRIWSGLEESEAKGGLFWTSKKIWSDKKEDKASLTDPYGRFVSTR